MDEKCVVFHFENPTHYANLMMRYLVAEKLKGMCPSIVFSNVPLQYWDIHYPSILKRPTDRVKIYRDEQIVPFTEFEYIIRHDLVDRIDWIGYGQRIENFPDKQICRQLFLPRNVPKHEIHEDELLCPIRAAEILDAIHPGYTILPIDFYIEMAKKTGLKPVFMGQTQSNVYIENLRKAFPHARFLHHISALSDFETIRSAANLLIPVSTFAWLAGWLSHARLVIMPVFGIFDPAIFTTIDLLPLSEKRYKFYQFPRVAAVPLKDLDGQHKSMRGQWSSVRREDLLKSYHGVLSD